MGYRHTQHGPWYYIIFLVLAFILILDAFLPGKPVPWWAYLIVAASVALPIFCFTSLTIYDAGDSLMVRFGPIPLIRKRIPYDAITHVEKGRTTWLDSWGLHYRTGWGWTYNVWGFDCVRVFCDRKIYNLGTDDPDGLLEFLQTKLGILHQPAE